MPQYISIIEAINGYRPCPEFYLIDLLVIYLVDANDVRVTAQKGRETDDRLREQLRVDLRGILYQSAQDSHYGSENSALVKATEGCE